MIAVNYGGRDEIRRAAAKLAEDVKEGRLQPEDITESVFASYLDTADIPDPDLLIRTSGGIKIVNYLLWQLAYTELYVTDCLWPDFDEKELEKAIIQYNKRDRRFGGVNNVGDIQKEILCLQKAHVYAVDPETRIVLVILAIFFVGKRRIFPFCSDNPYLLVRPV